MHAILHESPYVTVHYDWRVIIIIFIQSDGFNRSNIYEKCSCYDYCNTTAIAHHCMADKCIPLANGFITNG